MDNLLQHCNIVHQAEGIPWRTILYPGAGMPSSEFPFECVRCKREFVSLDTLWQHFRTEHRTEGNPMQGSSRQSLGKTGSRTLSDTRRRSPPLVMARGPVSCASSFGSHSSHGRVSAKGGDLFSPDIVNSIYDMNRELPRKRATRTPPTPSLDMSWGTKGRSPSSGISPSQARRATPPALSNVPLVTRRRSLPLHFSPFSLGKEDLLPKYQGEMPSESSVYKKLPGIEPFDPPPQPANTLDQVLKIFRDTNKARNSPFIADYISEVVTSGMTRQLHNTIPIMATANALFATIDLARLIC